MWVCCVTYQVVFDDLKDFIEVKVVSWLETTVRPTPGKRFSVLAEWLKLQQRVVDAVEEHLVVDVLAL